MKSKLLLIVTAVTLLYFPKVNFGQVISLGADASKFVIFTSAGLVDDNTTDLSHITGDVGTLTAGSITDFGNVDGTMHPGADAATAACVLALNATIAQINANPATLTGPLSLGSGATFTPGIYSIPGDATLTLDLILDAQGNPDAEFIIKIAGTFGANSLSKVKLINGAQACHVFWKIDGAVTMASLVTMRGNIITGGAVVMGSGDSLEGRIFSTPAGAITIDGLTAFMPIGCNSPYLTGPRKPDLLSLACYAIFSGAGALNGNLSSTSIGDVGNAGGGSVTGWTAGNVTGILHPTGDPSTMLAATDLSTLYDTLNAMVPDIELLYPALFGRNLVLTPHTYLLDAAKGTPTLTDSLYLNAQGNPNAVFVIKVVGGALVTSTNARVKLINGAQSKNVFWLVKGGGVSILDGSIFRGNIIVPVGAITLLSTGVVLDGRALTITGAITTAGLTAAMPSSMSITSQPANQIACVGDSISFLANATGSGITYQWRKGSVNLSNIGNISGVNSDTLTINPVNLSDAASDYNVLITSSCSPNDSSTYASLTVNAIPTITGTTPNSICGSGTVTLGATASAGIINWYSNPTGGLSLVTGITYAPIILVTDTFYVDATLGNCTTASRTAVIAKVNFNLTTNNPQTICNGNSYVFNGHTYTIADNYNDTLTTINGCDSVIVTQLTVNPAYLTNNPQTICSGNSYVFNGHTYTIANNYNDTLTAINGCDSVIVTQLTVNPAYLTNNPQTICSGNSYVFNGHTYTIANNYNDTLTTIDGCDSVIVTQLTVNPAYLTNNPQTICSGNSYVFNGHTYTIANNYNDTLTTINGCDSVIVTQLTVNPAYLTNNPQTICSGNSYVFNGHTYTIANNYNDTLTAINGCDSIIVTQLSVNPAYTTNNPQTICSGNSYVFNGHNYTIAANYNDTLTSINGCDSIIVTQLTVNPVYSTNNPQTICEGDSYVFNGHTYTLAGNFNDTLSTVNSCDSIIVTQLTVNQIPVAAANSNSPVCEGSSINLTTPTLLGGTYLWIGSNEYSSTEQNPVILSASTADAGTYSLVVSANGCSSAPSTITILVKNCVEFHIPEGFSPNADAINDLFVIRGIENYPANTIVIFNRWGNKVFEASPYQNTWDGKSMFGLIVGGDELPIGTYFYILDLGDGSKVIKGTIYLNR
ncbi:MAG: DUF3494 domain-containing protein [Bacteroidetes bacterium]|nr:DUF3494 domain-containing protein [Bacteroidota bacterium]